jgi:hypothetical protein
MWNRLQRKLFRLMKEELAGSWTKLHNLASMSDNTRSMEKSRARRAGDESDALETKRYNKYM